MLALSYLCSYLKIIILKKSMERSRTRTSPQLPTGNAKFFQGFFGFLTSKTFNADETGLYYRGYPDRGHCAKGSDLAQGRIQD